MLSDSFLSDSNELLSQLENLLAKVKACGADAAEGSIAEDISFDNRARYGKLTDLDHAESRHLGVRAFLGKRKADVALSLDKIKNMDEVAERLVSMARLAPEDPYCGLAEDTIKKEQIKEIDIYDSSLPDIQKLGEAAIEAEAAALAHAGISNSEGGAAGWSLSQNIYLTSRGFCSVERESLYQLSCSVLAEKDGAMERDYEYVSSHFAEDLPEPKTIGDKAAQLTLARCGAVKPQSTKAPVVYAPRVARSILGSFAAASAGASIARQTSFLKEALGKKIFNEAITITDDPFRKRGLRSQAFDSEGVMGATRDFVQAGVLQNFFLDSAAARQLNRTSTGHADGATNLFLTSSSAMSVEAMLASIDRGFYITELIGSGVNIVTGDYSRGAVGFLIENGNITQPVNEMTIVGNLKQVFANIFAANDLVFRYGVDAPTLCLGEMTIAGA